MKILKIFNQMVVISDIFYVSWEGKLVRILYVISQILYTCNTSGQILNFANLFPELYMF